MRIRFLVSVVSSLIWSPVIALDLDAYQLVDLSHTYYKDTLYWPTSPSSFEKTELHFGEVEGGYFYSAYTVCTPEHGGTHLDAPLHFAKEGVSTAEIPLENLIAPAIGIDVSKQAADDRNDRLCDVNQNPVIATPVATNESVQHMDCHASYKIRVRSQYPGKANCLACQIMHLC